MSALILAAGAPSKLPFYLLGGALAAWAVLLALLGLSRAEFPGTPGRARAVMTISALLVAGTIGTAIATASKPKHEAAKEIHGVPAAAGPVKIAADPGGQLKYDVKSVTAKAGEVTIDFANQSPIPHNVTIENAGKKVAATKDVTTGAATLKVALTPGTYTFYCSVDAHRQAGMQGQLKVS
jgi:plastocyanin